MPRPAFTKGRFAAPVAKGRLDLTWQSRPTKTIPQSQSGIFTWGDPGQATPRPGSTPKVPSQTASLPRPGMPILPPVWSGLSYRSLM
jgi:hypothetical protein